MGKAELILTGRGLSKSFGEGRALISSEPISFFGGVDPHTGLIIESGHQLEGKSITNRVLIFPHGKGSTVGAYTLYLMSKLGTAPAAIINVEADPVVIVGCIISNIPLVDHLSSNPLEVICNDDYVYVDGAAGRVKVVKVSQ